MSARTKGAAELGPKAMEETPDSVQFHTFHCRKPRAVAGAGVGTRGMSNAALSTRTPPPCVPPEVHMPSAAATAAASTAAPAEPVCVPTKPVCAPAHAPQPPRPLLRWEARWAGRVGRVALPAGCCASLDVRCVVDVASASCPSPSLLLPAAGGRTAAANDGALAVEAAE
eukprot:260208-Chlamydomonas_euryale.AAC.4